MGLVMCRAGRCLLLLGLAAAAWAVSMGVSAAEPLEYAVKAAYLTKFAFYVDWPPAAFATPTSPVVLCVVGEDPFGTLLDDAAAGQQVQGRAIVVRRMKSVGRDSGCHIVYLGAEARSENLHGSSALVVGDAGNSGIISFVLKDNRVRFTVDDEAAAHNGLAISSKLLNVALSVKPRTVR